MALSLFQNGQNNNNNKKLVDEGVGNVYVRLFDD